MHRTFFIGLVLFYYPYLLIAQNKMIYIMENKQLIQNGFDSWANKTGNFFDLLADDEQWLCSQPLKKTQ
jgi:hypothetical protein